MPEPNTLEPAFPQTIGECIYCGATDGLSDEHIIPFSLGGKWELRDASCSDCAKITTSLERHISREHLIAFRTSAGLPTYRPKKRPRTFNQRISDGSRSTVTLLAADHPAPIVFPLFERPGFLSGKEPSPFPSSNGVRVIARGAKVRALGQATGGRGYSVPLPDRAVFARFLAKVAFGFAVGCVGLKQFSEVFPRNAILGKAEDAGFWVGGEDPQPTEAGQDFHELEARQVEDLMSVHVRLFSQFNTPRYQVIVGRVTT